MRLELQRGGGVVGRTVRWSLDVDTLEPDRRAEVEQLLDQVRGEPGPSAAGADRFGYRLTADPPGADPVDVRLAEPLAEPAQRLLDLLRDAPLG